MLCLNQIVSPQCLSPSSGSPFTFTIEADMIPCTNRLYIISLSSIPTTHLMNLSLLDTLTSLLAGPRGLSCEERGHQTSTRLNPFVFFMTVLTTPLLSNIPVYICKTSSTAFSHTSVSIPLIYMTLTTFYRKQISYLHAYCFIFLSFS